MFAFLQTLFGQREAAAPPPSTRTDSTRTRAGKSSDTSLRKQLLAVVLKDTLLRGQLPPRSIGMEFLRVLDKRDTRTEGIHVRLVVRDDHPDLRASMLRLEREFRKRLAMFDYRATEWLQGISWQFDVEEAMEDANGALPTPAAVRDEHRILAAARLSARSSSPGKGASGGSYAYTEPAPLQ